MIQFRIQTPVAVECALPSSARPESQRAAPTGDRTFDPTSIRTFAEAFFFNGQSLIFGHAQHWYRLWTNDIATLKLDLRNRQLLLTGDYFRITLSCPQLVEVAVIRDLVRFMLAR